jgi:hypothetical protein
MVDVIPVVEAAPDPSFADLRKMIESDVEDTPVVVTPAAVVAKPAAETVPVSVPEKQQEPEEAVTVGVQKRFDRLTREKHDALRRAEVAEAKLQVTPQAAEPAKPTTVAATPTTPAGKPDPVKYTDWDTYQEALTNWQMDQRDLARAETQRQEAAKATDAGLKTSWVESETAAKGAHADYDDVMAAVGHIQVPMHLQRAILESDDKAELAYALAKSPADVERISKLPAGKALVELGKFAAKLTAPVITAPITQTALPKPPATVGGGAAPVPVDLEKCDFRTFKREFKKLTAE